ncbi:hypothetical protein ON010_g3920 [Phytophthora cinnamomi]|nr:hypothetical protein ON010_g3920 [Phytophthora cinnamomi]
MGKFRDGIRRLWHAWEAVQVETQGRYSVERIGRLNSYMKTASGLRVATICTFALLPCLILAIVVEAVPLAPPEDGVRANWVFLIRFGFVTGLMVGSMVFQMGKNVPALVVKTRHVLTIAILTALAAVATLYAVASATTFPVPFSMLLASPPSVVVYGICFAVIWGAQFKADPVIQKEMEQQTAVLNCQISLTLIYPMYIYGFTSFTGVYQTIFVIVLPIIKLVAKNWVSRALTGHNDLKPEAVIFNVEVFNALYISNALQIASTQASTITIMIVDVLHLWISIYDVMDILKDVKVLMAKIPIDHPHAKDNFVQMSMHLLDIETRHMSRTFSHFADASKPDWRAQVEEWVNSKARATPRNIIPISELPEDDPDEQLPSQSRKPLRGTRIFPIRPPPLITGWLDKKNPAATIGLGSFVDLESIFTRDERATFIRESARVLFITEYLVLVEYIEVVLPVVYCVHHAIVYNLHNRLAGVCLVDRVDCYSEAHAWVLVLAPTSIYTGEPSGNHTGQAAYSADIRHANLLGAHRSSRSLLLTLSMRNLYRASMIKRLQKTRQRLWAAWMSIQVELQGRYSVERLQQLEAYSKSLGSVKLAAIMLLTPLPSLVISLLKELPPLSPIEAGTFGNKTFFVRSWLVVAFINGNILVQMGQSAPRLKLTTLQVVVLALFAAGMAVAFIFLLCALTVFPLPFGLLVVSPPDVIMLCVCFVYISGSRWRGNSALWNDVKRQLSVFYCQVALTFIYPIYIYGFVSLTGIHQAMFVLILPIIQIIAKNWVSRQLTDNALKPESVIFIVEVFNALYVSNALHNSSSWKTTAMIMTIDFVHFWLSMLDVVEILDEVKALMAKIPRDHQFAKENFVHVAMRLIEIESMLKVSIKTNSTGASKVSWVAQMEAWVSSKSVLSKESSSRRDASLAIKIKGGRYPGKRLMTSARARLFPVRPPLRRQWLKAKSRVSPGVTENDLSTVANPTSSLGLETIFSRKERVLFVRKSARVLFITEYIVLIEYAEVVLPITYCLHEAILFHMHNRAYYPALAEMSAAGLLSNVVNVLMILDTATTRVRSGDASVNGAVQAHHAVCAVTSASNSRGSTETEVEVVAITAMSPVQTNQ